MKTYLSVLSFLLPFSIILCQEDINRIILNDNNYSERYTSIQLHQDGYIAVGKIYPFSGLFLVSQIGYEGNVNWTNYYSIPTDQYSIEILPGIDSGYIIASIDYNVSDQFRARLQKISEEGDLQWEHTYDELSDSLRLYITNFEYHPDSIGYILSGYVTRLGEPINAIPSYYEIGLEGEVLSHYSYNLLDTIPRLSVTEVNYISSEGILIGAQETSSGSPIQLSYVFSIERDGSLNWSDVIDIGHNNQIDYFNRFDNGYLAIGDAKGFDPQGEFSDQYLYLNYYDNEGVLMSQELIQKEDTTLNVRDVSISDKGIAILTQNSYSDADYSLSVVFYSEELEYKNEKFLLEETGQTTENGGAMIYDGDGNIGIAGWTPDSPFSSNGLVILTSDEIISNVLGTLGHGEDVKIDVHPKISDGYIYLKSRVVDECQVKISTLEGRVVHNQFFKGMSTISIDLHHLVNGIYIVNVRELSTNKFLTEKIILQK